MDKIFGKEQRLYWMGVAILWVFLFHIYTHGARMFPIMNLFKPFSDGYVGVDIFLYLSAFGLCASYSNNSLKQFYVNRTKRIIPTYVGFYILLSLTFWHSLSIYELLQNLILQLTGTSNFFYSELIEWYTPSLILLYAFFPLLHKFFYLRKLEDIISGGVIIVLLTIFVKVITHIFEGKTGIFLFCYRLPVFYLGMISYRLIKENKTDQLKIMMALTAFIGCFAMNKETTYSYATPLFLCFVSSFDCKLPFHRSLSFLGKHSYEIFLAQVLTTKFLFSSGYIDNQYVMLSTCVFGTIILTIIIYLLSTLFKNILKL